MSGDSVKQIVSEAFDVEPDLRDAFVRRACGNDPHLLAEVLSLLDAASRATDAEFLATRAQSAADDVAGDVRANNTAAQVPPPAGVPVLFGRYKVLERIGEGGMGIVYRAEQRVPMRREVVVKVIKLGMDTKLVIARFEAERQALAMMDHPHIAKVYDAGTDDRGRPYFVMEYVKGTPILDYCDRNHLDVRQRLELFTQVCQAIQHAHHKGIIHRDIKPSNILVSTQDGKAFARVIDFGIAKATTQRLTDRTLFTEHVNMIGTPAYMSPEQADGNIDIDTRTDVYSLGVVLYELLTGRTPFDSRRLKSAALNEIARIIREEDPPKPSTRMSTMNVRRAPSDLAGKSQVDEGLDTAQTLATLAKARGSSPEIYGKSLQGEIDWMVMKAIEKDRARRYDTPTAMADDIGRFLKGEPVLAAPPTMRYRVGKFVGRYKVPIAASVVIVILLLGGILISTWLAVRARAAEREAAAQSLESQRQAAVAQHERDQADDANQRAAKSETRAVEEATSAKVAAHYVSAQYALNLGRLAPAFGEISQAIQMRPSWESGYLLFKIVQTARDDWLPVVRIDEKIDSASKTCFCGRSGQILAVSIGPRLKLYRVATGQQLCDLDLSQAPQFLIAAGTTEVAVGTARRVTLYPISNPTHSRSATFESPAVCICCDSDGKHLAAFCEGGNTVVLDTSTMMIVAHHQLPAIRRLQTSAASGETTIQFSPSGKVVLQNSGLWTNPVNLWDWAADKLTQRKFGSANYLSFVDDQTAVALWRWESAVDSIQINVGRLDQTAIAYHSFQSRAAGNFQAWHPANDSDAASKDNLQAAATSDDSIELFSVNRGQSLADDRFGSLVPNQALSLRYLAFDPRSGFLALGGEQGICLFQSTRVGPVTTSYQTPSLWRMRFWSVTASNDALYYAYQSETHPKLRIVRIPFSGAKYSTSDCEWPQPNQGRTADVWGISITPDGKQLAALWQENSGGGNITSEYFRKQIIVYQLDPELNSSNPPRIEHQIPLDAYTGINGRDNRLMRLSPDAKAVAYLPASGNATCYSVTDCQPVAHFQACNSMCSSPDGSLIAGGVFTTDGPLQVWRTATGEKILTTSVTGKVRRLAISNDNKKLYVGWASEVLECIDIQTGKSLSKVSTKLAPVAISPRDDRFVGFLPDSAVRGSMVLGVLSTGETVLVLNEAVHILNNATFSPTGDCIATMRDRDIPAMFRSMNIDEANTALNRNFPPIDLDAEPATKASGR
jgi:serine/threonine protein kinase/WD40 repeat protein